MEPDWDRLDLKWGAFRKIPENFRDQSRARDRDWEAGITRSA
jgi:hypothetical protein